MDILFLVTVVFFFGIGLCFGSFALATAWRIRKKRDFVRDTSECEHCGHKLAPKDLVPVFSWLFLKGKCAYCKKPIPKLVPLAELFGGVVFACSFAFWPHSLEGIFDTTLFVLWCTALILLLILFFYDLQWFLLPNKLMYPLWAVSACSAIVYFVQEPRVDRLLFICGSVAVSAGLFYALFMISRGAWIGFGDVRLGVAMGLLLASPWLGGLALFIASCVGIVVSLPSLLKKQTKMTTKIPFGPLLIVGLIIAKLWGPAIIDWYMANILLL
jgi:prepilin signal peptidase PulO-like enzyme (type II secretory pathway)